MENRTLTTILLVILGIVVLFPLIGMTVWGFGGGHMWGPGMMGWGGMRGWGFGGFGALTLLLLVAGTVLLVIAFTRREPRVEEPLEILRRRLAAGELTREQYEELRQALR